jgi:hypothetical protein
MATKFEAGAGRGKQGGPTAKEVTDYDRKLDAGVYTIEKGKPPSPREMAKGGSVESTKMDKSQDKAMIVKAFKQHDAQKHKGGSGTSLKLAKGGVTRADGCVTKGHTKGRMV